MQDNQINRIRVKKAHVRIWKRIPVKVCEEAGVKYMLDGSLIYEINDSEKPVQWLNNTSGKLTPYKVTII